VTIELKMLLLATLIPLLLVTAQGTLLMGATGLAPLLGNREQFQAPQGWRGRWLRAHGNQLENLILFGLVVLVAHAAGVSTPVTRMAAEVFFAARLVHALTYIVGVLYVRTAAFYIGLIAIYALISQLF
jgi:uncharacterized MAPEG superfamily protein